jgi:hypothetical protein
VTTVTNRRNVLRVDGKFKVVGEIENGVKKADMLREFGLVNSASKICFKKTSSFNHADHSYKLTCRRLNHLFFPFDVITSLVSMR